MAILETVFPIMAIVLLGYWAARVKYLSESDCDSLSIFVFSFLIPMLLFIGTANAKIPDNMQWNFLLGFYGALLCIYFVSVLIAKYLFKLGVIEQSIFGMGASYSNATIVGIPICLYALGEEALLPLFIIVSVHNLVLFTVGIFVAQRDSLSLSSFLGDFFVIVRQLLSSPITASLILGGMVNLLDIPIYKPLVEAITLLSSAAVPSALFVLGCSLNRYKIQGHLAPALTIVALKTLCFPLLVWLLLFQVFDISTLWAGTALLTSAMPVGISAYIFSKKYSLYEAPIATSIVLSTLASLLSLSVVIAYLQSLQ